MKNIFDSHAHYNNPRFARDSDETIISMHQNGVNGIINVGYDLKVTEIAQKQAQKYPFMWFSAGIHPHDAAEVPSDYLSKLKNFSIDPKCVAIGEIGLDYFRNLSPKDVQKKVFIEQLDLAVECDLPVIIHTRDATKHTLDILSQYNLRGVVHCFSSSAETAKKLVSMGWYIGFTGVITFENAKRASEAAAVVPLDRLLVETDCPYMAPNPHRGKRCTSDMIAFTAEKLGEIHGLSGQKILDITNKNASDLFGVTAI